jgi:hypothetical protein
MQYTKEQLKQITQAAGAENDSLDAIGCIKRTCREVARELLVAYTETPPAAKQVTAVTLRDRMHESRIRYEKRYNQPYPWDAAWAAGYRAGKLDGRSK